MDLRQLNALVAVAESGSFSAAARAIHTVQSNVSTHVARLERELGAVLVDRSTGRLTEEGHAAASRARRIRAELDGLTSDVAALRDVVVGHVRLGVIGSVGRWLVPELVAEMGHRHPEVDVVIVDASTTSLLPQVLDGSLDLAVVNLPVKDPELVTEALFEEERILVAPLGHPLAAHGPHQRDPVTIGDLLGHRLVLEPRGTAFRDELDAAVAAAGGELTTVAEVDGMTMVASLAFRGLGPAVLPATAIVGEREEGWIHRPIHGLRHRAVGFVRRRTGRPAASGRAVEAAVRDLLERTAPGLEGVELAVG